MALNIKNAETDRLAREVAAATGETITQAVNRALQERLERVRRASRDADLVDDIARIAKRSGSRPVLDDRTADEILGYDDHGLPT